MKGGKRGRYKRSEVMEWGVRGKERKRTNEEKRDKGANRGREKIGDNRKGNRGTKTVREKDARNNQ